MTFAGIFDSEAEFDAFFAELYAEAGLTVCDVKFHNLDAAKFHNEESKGGC